MITIAETYECAKRANSLLEADELAKLVKVLESYWLGG